MKVTHPFHPLSGREFEYVGRRVAWGEPRVYFYDEEGRVRAVPAGWTDADSPHPFDLRAAGRCPFRADDLAELAVLVARLRGRDGVKETSPHM